MTKRRVTRIRAAAMALGLCLGAAATAVEASDDLCSLATLSGPYGFSINGTNYASDVSWAFVGQFSADGAGEFQGTGTQSVKGKIGRVRFTGKYNVSTDCSGSAKLQFTGGPAAMIDFVIVNDGQELHLIVADQGTLETGVAKRVRVRAAVPAPKPAPTGAGPRTR
jgi:hypothetical protein